MVAAATAIAIAVLAAKDDMVFFHPGGRVLPVANSMVKEIQPAC